jgi:hypothetical protein
MTRQDRAVLACLRALALGDGRAAEAARRALLDRLVEIAISECGR